MQHGKEIGFLIGFMGCGKSTIGKMLAKELDWAFIDSDEWIASESGMSIPEMFKSHGEDEFRRYEKDFIDHITSLSNTIIATGGGLPCYGDSMKRLNRIGATIYLKCGLEALFRRLEKDGNRPLLQNMDDSQLKNFIRYTISKRKQFYEQADLTLMAFQDPNQIVKKIIKSNIF